MRDFIKNFSFQIMKDGDLVLAVFLNIRRQGWRHGHDGHDGHGQCREDLGPHSDSDAYELVTPKLQANKGDVLRFYANISSGWLNLEYKVNDEEDWRFDRTYITADAIYFVAPLSATYQLRFSGSSVSVDDFVGNAPEGFSVETADVNDDGFINAADIVMLIKIIEE